MKKKPSDIILMHLKMRGEADSKEIASELNITKEGARKHLLQLASEGWVETVAKSEGVGRPSIYYKLTDKGLSKFPDSHAQVTVELLQSVKKLLGENALDLLISDREKQVYQRYEKEVGKTKTLESKLNRLCKIRSDEGYMAEWKKENGAYFLIENHCPICAVATECQGFCRTELTNFRQLLGNDYTVERIQHIVTGGQRCTYRITKSV